MILQHTASDPSGYRGRDTQVLGSPAKGYLLQLQSGHGQMTEFSIPADMNVETPLSDALTHELIRFLALILPIQSVF